MKYNLSFFISLVMAVSALSSCSNEEPTLATVSTGAVLNLRFNGATGNGTVENDGGGSVSNRGFCWSTSELPTIEDALVEAGEGLGSFSAEITELIGATTYFVRAYAINEAGVAYGEEVSFTTLPAPVLAQLTTTPISAITANAAQSGGTITNSGNSIITAQGICWGTTPAPTILGSKTTESLVANTFTSTLTGLSAGTTYYVRAYATNEVGTAYGNEISFSTNFITATLFAIKDAAIFNNQSGNAVNGNYGAGGSELLQVGFASPTGIYARSLIQFDLSSIPSNAVIESASLQFTTASSGTFTPEIRIQRLLQNWTEGTTSFCTYNASCNTQGVAITNGGSDVTWNERSYSSANTNLWTTAGGTFSSETSALSIDVGNTVLQYASSGLKTDVQGWVNNGSTNFGWILRTDFITNTSAMRRFRSREGAIAAGDASTAPKLVVVYR
jgi:hypothetical protein